MARRALSLLPLPLFLLPLFACGENAGAPPPAAASAQTPASAAPAPSPPVLSAASAAPPPQLPPPRSLADETRATLEQMVAVDTSHGHETDLLKPIEERFRAAGLAVDFLESATGRGNLIARYKGNGSKRPLLLLAHVDVVPVEGQPWTVPTFKVTEKDGYVYGRGVNDDKDMAAVIVAIALEFARTKPALSRDVIFALTAGEETGGHAGVEWLVKNHKDLLDAEIALNELGGIFLTEDQEKIQLVATGVAEKTTQTYHLTVKGKGGHSSLPPPDLDPVVTLARALVKIGQYRFPAKVLPATKEQFAGNAPFEPKPLSDVLKRISASGRIGPEDDRVLSQDTLYRALTHTTCVTTQLQGAPQNNALPTTAEANVNCRLLPDEKRDQVMETLKKVIGDPAVEITAPVNDGYGPYSDANGFVPAEIKKVANELWPGVPVVPSMGTGATDSRHLRGIGIAAYGVSTTPLTRKEAVSVHRAHGPDERHPAKWIEEGARFLRALALDLAK